MWHSFVLEAIVFHLDPIDLIRLAGVCKNWRRLALRQCLWSRFIASSSHEAFIKFPLKREPKFMFLKRRDWDLIPTRIRDLVEESDVLKQLLASGAMTIWMLKW